VAGDTWACFDGLKKTEPGSEDEKQAVEAWRQQRQAASDADDVAVELIRSELQGSGTRRWLISTCFHQTRHDRTRGSRARLVCFCSSRRPDKHRAPVVYDDPAALTE
jgi:hypothetical protein